MFLFVALLLASGQLLSATTLKPEVARAQFTTHIKENREPADNVVLLGNSVKEVFYFTDLRNLSGKTVKHRWEHNGEVIAEFPLKVKVPRARMHSSLTLDKKKLGKYTALVVDESGWVLKATQFEYIPAALAR